jgi:hypothetical protein
MMSGGSANGWPTFTLRVDQTLEFAKALRILALKYDPTDRASIN